MSGHPSRRAPRFAGMYEGLVECRRFLNRRRFLPYVAAALGALLFVNLFGRMPVEVAGFLLEVGARVDWEGQTRIFIPPVGEIRAPTHAGPLSFSVTLWNIDMAVVRDLLDEPAGPLREWERWMAEAYRHAAGQLALRLAGLGAFGGGLAAWAAARAFRLRRWLSGALTGLLTAAALVAPAYWTYDTAAFARAEYRGIIETAPWMVEAVRNSLGRVEELGSQLRSIAANLYTLFDRIDDLGRLGLPPADLVVLHTSDLHNNAAALDFVEAVAQRFGVDLIIDTGDITDWGTPLEAGLVDRIGGWGLPYVLVPGNHESPLVLERLRRTPHVIVLEDELITLMGLRIYGFTDPGAYSESPRHLESEAALQRARYIEEAVAQLDTPPDIIAVHNHRTAWALPDGIASVVLFGHDHRLHVDTSGRTVRVNAGSTGAAGLRGLQAGEPVPYSLAILYFARTAGALRLAVIDTVRVYTLPARGLTLERIVLEEPVLASKDPK